MKMSRYLACGMTGFFASLISGVSPSSAQNCPQDTVKSWRHPYNTVTVDHTINFTTADDGALEDYDTNTDAMIFDGPTGDYQGDYHNVAFKEEMLGFGAPKGHVRKWSNGVQCLAYVGTIVGTITCNEETTVDYAMVIYNRNIFFLPNGGYWNGVCRNKSGGVECVTETKELVARHELGHIFGLRHTESSISVMNDPINWVSNPLRDWFYTLRQYDIDAINCLY